MILSDKQYMEVFKNYSKLYEDGKPYKDEDSRREARQAWLNEDIFA